MSPFSQQVAEAMDVEPTFDRITATMGEHPNLLINTLHQMVKDLSATPLDLRDYLYLEAVAKPPDEVTPGLNILVMLGLEGDQEFIPPAIDYLEVAIQTHRTRAAHLRDLQETKRALVSEISRRLGLSRDWQGAIAHNQALAKGYAHLLHSFLQTEIAKVADNHLPGYQEMREELPGEITYDHRFLDRVERVLQDKKATEMKMGYLEYYAEVVAKVFAPVPEVSIPPLKALWDLRAREGKAGCARSYAETGVSHHLKLAAMAENAGQQRARVYQQSLGFMFLRMADLLPEQGASAE